MHAFSVDGGQTTSVPAFQIRWEEGELSLLQTHLLTPGTPATGDSDGDSRDGGEPGRNPRRVWMTETGMKVMVTKALDSPPA